MEGSAGNQALETHAQRLEQLLLGVFRQLERIGQRPRRLERLNPCACKLHGYRDDQVSQQKV